MGGKKPTESASEKNGWERKGETEMESNERIVPFLPFSPPFPLPPSSFLLGTEPQRALNFPPSPAPPLRGCTPMDLWSFPMKTPLLPYLILCVTLCLARFVAAFTARSSFPLLRHHPESRPG